VSSTGYDDAPYINTVHVRYPDADRVKGEPHDVQEYFTVKAIEYWDSEALNMLRRKGARCHKPDYDKINEITERYQKIGNVTVMDNNLF